jgi:hypothetical protein
MEPECEIAICLLDLCIGGGLADAEDVVVVLLGSEGGDLLFHLLLFFVRHLS